MKKYIILIAITLVAFQSYIYSQGSRYTGSYTPSQAIVRGKISNIEISGLSFTGLNQTNITIYDCSNIVIKNCKFSKTFNTAIHIENGNNITIQDCVFDSVADGILVSRNANNPFNNGTSSGIKVIHNYFRNTVGGVPGHHCVQFGSVDGGGGNQINYNSIENIHLQSHTDDMISLFNSYGSINDSIQIIGNWIRGGDYNIENHTGGCITFGDNGGSYIHVKNNIIVNVVCGGIGNAGANHTVVENNIVYQSKETADVDACGYIMHNFTTNSDSTDCYENTWRNNRGYSLNRSGGEGSYKALLDPEHNNKFCTVAIGLETNVVDKTLNASILPQNIAKAKGVVSDTPSTPSIPSPLNYNIFPNPVNGQLTIKTSDAPNSDKVMIYNLQGQKIYEQALVNQSTVISTNNISTGIYIVKIADNASILNVQKIIVDKN